MRKVTCMCEATFDADLPEEIDLDAVHGNLGRDPGWRISLPVECPNCGTRPQARAQGAGSSPRNWEWTW